MTNPNRLHSTPIDYEGPLHMSRRARKILGVTALSVSLLSSGVIAAHEAITKTTVDEVTLGIDGSAINTVDEAAHILAEQQHIPYGAIADITPAGREVNKELQDRSGRAAQPGEQIKVTLEQNGFGQYDVAADPANLAHLTK